MLLLLLLLFRGVNILPQNSTFTRSNGIFPLVFSGIWTDSSVKKICESLNRGNGCVPFPEPKNAEFCALYFPWGQRLGFLSVSQWETNTSVDFLDGITQTQTLSSAGEILKNSPYAAHNYNKPLHPQYTQSKIELAHGKNIWAHLNTTREHFQFMEKNKWNSRKQWKHSTRVRTSPRVSVSYQSLYLHSSKDEPIKPKTTVCPYRHYYYFI